MENHMGEAVSNTLTIRKNSGEKVMKESLKMEKNGASELKKAEDISIEENSKEEAEQEKGDYKTAKVTFLMASSKKVSW
jgi:hypothetical protein